MYKIIITSTVSIFISLFSYSMSFHSSTLINYQVEDSLQPVSDTLSLLNYALKFNATEINITNSIFKSTELNQFLLNANKVELKTKTDFDLFIVLLVLKEYELQMTKFHQGFDLFSNKIGNGSYIIDSFFEIANVSKDVKWLNSSFIMDFIASNEKFNNEPSIVEIVAKINSLPK